MHDLEEKPSPLITLRDVSYAYWRTSVLKNISLTINQGDTVVLLGNNGSGKSTLLALLASLLTPSRGKRVIKQPLRVGYFAHKLLLYLDLTPLENLAFFSSILGLPAPDMCHLETWGLAHTANRPLRELSQGTRAKVALCRALLGDPELLLLDEPTATLDAEGVERLQEILGNRKRTGSATVIATHEADRFGALQHGTVTLHNGTLKQHLALEGNYV
jgi:ABC-type multidrug transport system ATPase subunit